MLPVVAIVGRPNVGKSSLFNRLIGKRRAIESPISGTTRDQISERAFLNEREVLLVDTGGLQVGSEGDIEADVQMQAKMAMEGADVVIFMVDARQEMTADDFHAAHWLRKSSKRCILVANKCDNAGSIEEKTFNLYELGFGDPIGLSALHGMGMDELKREIEQELEKQNFVVERDRKEEEGLRLTFIGRPNVGKSSLVNALFGKEKVIVSEVPGTTRDTIHIPFTYEGNPFVLVDTAGLRRRGKIAQGIEKYSVLRSFQSIEDSDVVVLVIDGNEGLKAQDLHICEFILAQYKGLIVVVNKVDLFEEGEEDRNRIENTLRHRMAFMPWAPVIFVSAKERKNLFKLLEIAQRIGEERKRIVKAEELNVWLQEVVMENPSSGAKGKYQAKIFSVEQVIESQPTFVFQVSHPEVMHFSYKRYLENRLREQFGFDGTAIHLIFRNAFRPSSPRRRAIQRS